MTVPTLAAAIVVAAGRGTRLGSDLPKALVHLAGRPIVWHAVKNLPVPLVSITVGAPPGFEDEIASAVLDFDVRVVTGGETRTDTVRLCLDSLDGPGGPTHVVVHDAARALMPATVAQAAIDAVTGEVVAAAPAIPVPDTLKRADSAGGPIETVDRSGVQAVQTPQVFRLSALLMAHERAAGPATDDLTLVENLIASGELDGRVVLVAGDPRGLKITTPEDLEIAEAILARQGRS